MKKHWLTTICLLVMAFVHSSAYTGEISWLTSYEEAINQSKEQTKPLVLFFTGSDWCTWCNKLEEEALNTPAFADEIKDKFIFVKLDYPMQKKLSAALIDQNKQLQEKYDIRSFPTIIILDTDQQQIGITGYRPGGGKPYADHLKKMMHDYSAYKSKVKTIAQGKLSSSDLKHLFRKAQEYNLNSDQIAVIEVGMKSDRADYFMIERYRLLANEGKIHDKEAVSLREQLRKFDYSNQHFTHYQLACIEFNAYASEMEKENYPPDIAVAPLVNYIQNFGANDQEHLWRINMIISQVYSNHNQHDKAVKFAECAHDCAPESTKPEIALAIKTLKSNK